jgi:DNA mismatch repair protein MSH6
MSKTVQVVRYWSPKVRKLVAAYNEAKEIQDESLRTIRIRFYAKFDTQYPKWLNVIKRLAHLDCLLGLTICKSSLGEGPVCRPTFVSGDGVFDVVDLRHPCIVNASGKTFIPNDTLLGGGDGNIILLTGPNMGGKSTLLRQTCLAVIMAQSKSFNLIVSWMLCSRE